MTARGREALRDVAMIVSLAISLASVGGVMLAQSNASAQWVQKTDGRLAAIEKRNETADQSKAQWRSLVTKALTRSNFLCVNDPDCNRYFARVDTETGE